MTTIQVIVGGTAVLFALGVLFVYEMRSSTESGDSEPGTPPPPHGTDPPE